MLRNFFVTAIRNLARNKTYSIINFVGLTCGITLSLLVIIYVRSELSFDKFHTNADNLYRLSYTAPNGLKLASTPPPIAPRLKEYFPSVQAAARMYGRSVTVSKASASESFEESNVFFADSAITDIFSFEFLSGDPKRALRDKFTVLITEQIAKKYFGDKDPLDETLVFAGEHPFKVAGVIKRFPDNSHINFDMLVPYDNMFDLETPASAKILKDNLDINFIISHSYTYVLVKPGSDPAEIDRGMEAFLKKYAQPQLLVGQVFTLMPVTDIHLKSTLLVEPGPVNTMANLYIFIAVGILTLLIACINYVNLSTAQSLTRIKEIGIRKILGSLKRQLIAQFLAESFLFCLGALVLSYALVYFTLPLLNQALNKNLVFSEELNPSLVTASLGVLLIVTVIAGTYPAIFVARFNSIGALKNSGDSFSGPQLFRKVLVVVQLAVACMLLSGSIIIMRQLDFLNEQPLGFQKEHVITVPLFSSNLNGIFRQNDSTFWLRLQSFRDAVESQSGVKATTLSSNAPGLGAIFRGTIPDGFTQEDNLFIANMSVDPEFLQTYGMKVIAGRGFNKADTADVAGSFIINEKAVQEFHWDTPQDAIGKSMNREGKKGTVVGVIADFNFTSLTTPVSSMVLEVNPNQYNTLSIKFDNSSVDKTIETLQNTWTEMFPEKSFAYTFLDVQLGQQYQNFQNFGSIIQFFTLIAIIISCLGVYGLVLFVVQRKVKEIGVRKVLGAGIGSILTLIYSDFVWLIVLGFAIAVPVSYYLISGWMENFTYRIDVGVAAYAISFLVILFIVAATVAYQAARAAIANPVKSLRSE
jgi:putative ABC transport system permease protein